MTLRNYFRLLAEDRACVSHSAWFWKPILNLIAVFYGLVLSIRRSFYGVGLFKQHAFKYPVISIGNITWGGTGKTPLVEYVARFFLNRNNIPLILARGYGQDESKLLSRQLQDAKFGIGADRFLAGEKALAAHPADVIILDDGFQHWRIKRNLDIVVMNVLNPFGNFSLIPRGILREPLSSLKRASIIVLTDVNLSSRKELEEIKTKVRKIAPKIEFVEAYREALYFYRPGSRERIQANRLQGMRVTSFSGIGTPRSFQMLLNQLNLKTIRNFEFSDHHHYSERELKEILRAKETSESEEMITTEKDFFRSEELMKRIVKPLILKVRLHLANGEGLLHQYLGRYAVARRVENFERRPNRFVPRRNPPVQKPPAEASIPKDIAAVPSEGKPPEKEISEHG
ncbi:MAG: tetraacyldisaccharide 4'-kinase [Candidatus Omnitrophica bacterium]|nr:tetraacyldisaccharide 4'-kinase [Candidatus Omnitrophota bacterium]